MIKDYIRQLHSLQEDRSQFQKQHQKHAITRSLSRQEDKYQAYIIDQMTIQDRIIASSQIATSLQRLCRFQQNYFLKNLLNFKPSHQIAESQQHIQKKKECHNSSKGDQNITVEFVLLQICTKLICRHATKAQNSQKRAAFDRIVQYSKRKQVLTRLTKNIGNYFYRHCFHKFEKLQKSKDVHSQALFTDSFSMIAFQDHKKKNHDDFCLSFIEQKENLSHSRVQTPPHDKQLHKLKEELSYLKHLLAQKNIQLKTKQDLIEQLQNHKIDTQQSIISQNSSYYSQLERDVLGGKRIVKSGSRVSSFKDKEEISKELLGKYMRQSFQLKESIDVVREMCLQLQKTLPASNHRQMLDILKVLNRGEEVSLLDQY